MDDVQHPTLVPTKRRPATTTERQPRAKKPKRGKRAQREVDEVDEDDEEDGEYNGDEEVVLREKSRSKSNAIAKVCRSSPCSLVFSSFRRADYLLRKQSSSRSHHRRASSEIDSPPPQHRPRSRPSLTKTTSGSPAILNSAAYSAQNDKTRKHCIAQLSLLFQSIFGETPTTADRSLPFASAVEAVLFTGFSEPDPQGYRAPRTKYLAKFRSLHFNLKTNAPFRSSIAAEEVDAEGLVNMSNEDLMRPELKAMAESVRAASLKHSVKEVLAAPTAKRTHKGEEEIDNFAGAVEAEEKRKIVEFDRRTSSAAENKERSDSIAGVGAGASPGMQVDDAAGQSPRSPGRPRHSLTASTVEDLKLNAGPSSPASITPLDAAPKLDLLRTSVGKSASPTPATPTTNEGTMGPPALPASRSSFDMASIWGQVKPATPTTKVDEMHEEEEEDDAGAEYDPFASSRSRRNAKDDDDDIDAILRDSPNKPLLPRSTTPPLPPSTSANLTELTPIWTGDVIVPDEGGFPAFGVQVGGDHFGYSSDVWSQLLPRGLTMEGRIPTKVATKYLVECSFASTRELVVIALLPDLTGPTDSFRDKPTGERCKAKRDHLINFYVKKERIGVITPAEKFKKIVKDIYIIPLKKDDALPEYIELLDDHLIPDTVDRTEDLLLCVLVIQKGAMSSARMPFVRPEMSTLPPLSAVPDSYQPPPPSNPIDYSYPAPSSLPLPAPSTNWSNPPVVASVAAPAMPSLPDLSSLSSFLSNPALLQSVLAAAANPASTQGYPDPSLLAALAGSGITGAPPGAPSNSIPDYRSSYQSQQSYQGYPNNSPRQGAYGNSSTSNYGSNYNSAADGRGSASPMTNPTTASPPAGGRKMGYVHPDRLNAVAGSSAPQNSSSNAYGGGGGGGYQARDDWAQQQPSQGGPSRFDDRSYGGGNAGGGRGGRGGGQRGGGDFSGQRGGGWAGRGGR